VQGAKTLACYGATPLFTLLPHPAGTLRMSLVAAHLREPAMSSIRLCRPENRCRDGAEPLPDLNNVYRSEAFAEDLDEPGAARASKAPAKPGGTMRPLLYWKAVNVRYVKSRWAAVAGGAGQRLGARPA
jgi:hypothetical protein